MRPANFVIHDGSVYLLTRKTFSIPLFMAVLRKEDVNWDSKQLQTLFLLHNELKMLWPDSNANNLGVDWVFTGKSELYGSTNNANGANK